MELKFHHKETKVQQLTNYIQDAISQNELKEGDKLPSINYLSKTFHVSRDTVFKAFLKLKDRGLIDSIHGKNYFVSSQSSNILLLLDEYTPFKEALYNNLTKKIPPAYKVDLLFHQYNKNLFETIISESLGRYSKYLVMNYDNETFSDVLTKIDKDRLLLLDFGKFNKEQYSYICQDFDEAFYEALKSVKTELSKYEKLIFVLNKQHKHPQSSKAYFSKFCMDNGFDFEIRDDVPERISLNHCYIVIKQMDVVNIVKLSRLNKMQIGKDFGLIAYNENPFYEVIGDGVPCISIDFDLLGSLAGDFVLSGEKIQRYLPTKVYRKNFI